MWRYGISPRKMAERKVGAPIPAQHFIHRTTHDCPHTRSGRAHYRRDHRARRRAELPALERHRGRTRLQGKSVQDRFEMAYGKAYAALSLGRSSKLVRERAQERPIFMRYLIAASGEQ